MRNYALFYLTLMMLVGLCLPAQSQVVHQNALSCTPAVTGGTPTSFNFKMGLVSGGPYVVIGSPPTCSWVDNKNMVEGQTRFYVMTAVNSAGESGPSVEVSATTPFSKPDSPTAPKAVSQ